MRKNQWARSVSGGFSLIEVLVAIGILAILGQGVMTLMSQFAKRNGHMEALTLMEDYRGSLAHFLSASTNCSAFLGTRTFNPTPAALSTQIIPSASETLPLLITETLPPGRVLASQGHSLQGKATIARLEVADFSPVVSGQYTANLVLEFSSANSPGLPFIRRIPLSLSTTNVSATSERVDSCVAIGGGGSGGTTSKASAFGQWGGLGGPWAPFSSLSPASLGNAVSLSTQGGKVLVISNITFHVGAPCDHLSVFLRENTSPWIIGGGNGNCNDIANSKHNVSQTHIFSPPAGTHTYELGGSVFRYPNATVSGSVGLGYRSLTAIEL